jgi:hypothetical protein
LRPPDGLRIANLHFDLESDDSEICTEDSV